MGKVSLVSHRTRGLYQEVEVRPVVDFSALEEVLVILAAAPPPVPKLKVQPQPARGIAP